jgi:hypothetical protein
MTKIIQFKEHNGLLHALGNNGRLYWYAPSMNAWVALPELPADPPKMPFRPDTTDAEILKKWNEIFGYDTKEAAPSPVQSRVNIAKDLFSASTPEEKKAYLDCLRDPRMEGK